MTLSFLFFHQDLPPVMRPDLTPTPPVKKGDLVSMDLFGEELAKVLWTRGIAVTIKAPNKVKPVNHLHGKMAKMKTRSKTKQVSLRRWLG